MNSYLPEKQLLICGYPRSGNTWLARLLGETLDSPVTGYKNAKPLAEEGLDRKGEYIVRQLHLRPVFDFAQKEFIPTAYLANLPYWKGEKVVHVFRDPRDVAVSVMGYWNLESIDVALDCMINSLHPVKTHGPWLKFVTNWFLVTSIPVVHISYEMLHTNTDETLTHILEEFGIEFDRRNLLKAIIKQSFHNKKDHIKSHSAHYNYGSSIQLKAMRKGIVGDYKNHFNDSQLELAQKEWGSFLKEMGYG